MNDKPELTVYFDGSCPLCSAEIGYYERQRGADAIVFVDVAADGSDTGPGLSCDTAMKRFHVRRADGTLLSGARAFVAIWETLHGWRWAARIARLPGIVSLLEVGYRLFLPIRPALSRLARRFGAEPRSIG